MKMENKTVFTKGDVEPILTEGNALLKAAWLGRLRLTRLLIEGGTDINGVNDEGQTALMISCMTKHKDAQSVSRAKMVKYLLENKANPNVKDRHGKTAVMYACIENAGHEVVRFLLEYDADPRLEDKRGSSALVYAVDSGDAKVLKLLVDACKAKGKEVIIITTNNNRHKRETKQYLDVPSALSSSPPFYKCATPSDIEIRANSATPSPVPSNSSNDEASDVIFKFPVPMASNLRKDKSSATINVEGAVTNAEHVSSSPTEDSLTLNTASIPESPEHSASVLKTRREELKATLENYPGDAQALARARARGRRGSLEPLQLSSHPANGDGNGQIQLLVPQRHKGATPSPPPTPPSQRRRITRRQSIDALQTSSLLTVNTEPKKSLSAPSAHHRDKSVGSAETLTDHQQQFRGGRSSRRGSLPSMPPPLLKRQTIHSISVPQHIRQLSAEHDKDVKGSSKHLSLNSPSRSTQSSSESLTPTSPSTRRRSPRGALLERRGSGALLLDELSHRRLGVFPPLNINPNPPLPDIGANITTTNSPLHQRSSPKKELPNRHSKPAPLLRRQSFEADHLRQLSTYMDTRSSLLCSPSEISDTESEDSEY
ncbi:ankyrin repeat domain-containing protein 34C-like [Glandiceps talaboti]